MRASISAALPSTFDSRRASRKGTAPRQHTTFVRYGSFVHDTLPWRLGRRAQPSVPTSHGGNMDHLSGERATASAQTPAEIAAGASPNLALLHLCMLLAGFGTVFLGPTLPVLAANAHASDSGSGLFFTAQFVGAFFGGVTTSSRLW